MEALATLLEAATTRSPHTSRAHHRHSARAIHSARATVCWTQGHATLPVVLRSTASHSQPARPLCYSSCIPATLGYKKLFPRVVARLLASSSINQAAPNPPACAAYTTFLYSPSVPASVPPLSRPPPPLPALPHDILIPSPPLSRTVRALRLARATATSAPSLTRIVDGLCPALRGTGTNCPSGGVSEAAARCTTVAARLMVASTNLATAT